MNAEVKINVSVNSRKRSSDVWKETTSFVETFHLITDLETYNTVVHEFASTVHDYVQDMITSGYLENFTHAQIRLDNVTHPIPGAGVVPLPKGHRDLALSDGDFVSSFVLEEQIKTAIADLQQRAKY